MMQWPSSRPDMIRIAPVNRCKATLCHRPGAIQIAATHHPNTSANRQPITPIQVLPRSAKSSRAGLAGHSAEALSP